MIIHICMYKSCIYYRIEDKGHPIEGKTTDLKIQKCSKHEDICAL